MISNTLYFPTEIHDTVKQRGERNMFIIFSLNWFKSAWFQMRNKNIWRFKNGRFSAFLFRFTSFTIMLVIQEISFYCIVYREMKITDGKTGKTNVIGERERLTNDNDDNNGDLYH